MGGTTDASTTTELGPEEERAAFVRVERTLVEETCALQGIGAGVRPDESLRVHRSRWGETPHTPRGERGLEALLGTTHDDEATARPGDLSLLTLDLSTAPAVEAASDLRIVGSIDKGGMGWVRAAEQRSIGRLVAVKTLLPARRGPQATQAILREARIAGRLEHPNIVPVHTIGWSEDEGPVLVMKHIEGASWRTLARDPAHPIWSRFEGDPLERNLHVLMQVCAAVQYAHARHVIHRDIKPANVMVGSFGEVYLLDWGVAATAAEQTAEGGGHPIVGTPAYMAPEMADPESLADERTDVYLLGASLHEVLTGGPRHTGADVQEVLLSARLSEPRVYGAAVPEELGAICNRACHADPAGRFAGPDALRAALSDFLRHRGSVATARRAREELVALAALLTMGALPPSPRGGLLTMGALPPSPRGGLLTAGTAPQSSPGGLPGGQEDDSDRALAVHRRFSACRFGFQQALGEWPENADARTGLQEALERMVAFELAAGDPRSAALLLAELPEARPALADRVEAARKEAEARERAEEELGRMRREARIGGRDLGRSIGTILNGLCTAGLLVWTGQKVRASGGDVDPVHALGVVVGAAVVNVVSIVVFRRAVLDNERYWRLMIATGCMGLLVIMSHVLGLWLGMSFRQVFAGDCLVVCAMATTLAATFDRQFWVSSAISVASIAVAFRNVDHAPYVIAAGYWLFSLHIAWVVRPGRAEGSLQDDPGAGRQPQLGRAAGARPRDDRPRVHAGGEQRPP